MKARLEREFAILEDVNARREAGCDVDFVCVMPLFHVTIEQQIVNQHLIELELQEVDTAIEDIKQQGE